MTPLRLPVATPADVGAAAPEAGIPALPGVAAPPRIARVVHLAQPLPAAASRLAGVAQLGSGPPFDTPPAGAEAFPVRETGLQRPEGASVALSPAVPQHPTPDALAAHSTVTATARAGRATLDAASPAVSPARAAGDGGDAPLSPGSVSLIDAPISPATVVSTMSPASVASAVSRRSDRPHPNVPAVPGLPAASALMRAAAAPTPSASAGARTGPDRAGTSMYLSVSASSMQLHDAATGLAPERGQVAVLPGEPAGRGSLDSRQSPIPLTATMGGPGAGRMVMTGSFRSQQSGHGGGLDLSRSSLGDSSAHLHGNATELDGEAILEQLRSEAAHAAGDSFEAVLSPTTTMTAGARPLALREDTQRRQTALGPTQSLTSPVAHSIEVLGASHRDTAVPSRQAPSMRNGVTAVPVGGGSNTLTEPARAAAQTINPAPAVATVPTNSPPAVSAATDAVDTSAGAASEDGNAEVLFRSPVHGGSVSRASAASSIESAPGSEGVRASGPVQHANRAPAPASHQTTALAVPAGDPHTATAYLHYGSQPAGSGLPSDAAGGSALTRPHHAGPQYMPHLSLPHHTETAPLRAVQPQAASLRSSQIDAIAAAVSARATQPTESHRDSASEAAGATTLGPVSRRQRPQSASGRGVRPTAAGSRAADASIAWERGAVTPTAQPQGIVATPSARTQATTVAGASPSPGFASVHMVAVEMPEAWQPHVVDGGAAGQKGAQVTADPFRRAVSAGRQRPAMPAPFTAALFQQQQQQQQQQPGADCTAVSVQRPLRLAARPAGRSSDDDSVPRSGEPAAGLTGAMLSFGHAAAVYMQNTQGAGGLPLQAMLPQRPASRGVTGGAGARPASGARRIRYANVPRNYPQPWKPAAAAAEAEGSARSADADTPTAEGSVATPTPVSAMTSLLRGPPGATAALKAAIDRPGRESSRAGDEAAAPAPGSGAAPRAVDALAHTQPVFSLKMRLAQPGGVAEAAAAKRPTTAQESGGLQPRPPPPRKAVAVSGAAADTVAGSVPAPAAATAIVFAAPSPPPGNSISAVASAIQSRYRPNGTLRQSSVMPAAPAAVSAPASVSDAVLPATQRPAGAPHAIRSRGRTYRPAGTTAAAAAAAGAEVSLQPTTLAALIVAAAAGGAVPAAMVSHAEAGGAGKADSSAAQQPGDSAVGGLRARSRAVSTRTHGGSSRSGSGGAGEGYERRSTRSISPSDGTGGTGSSIFAPHPALASDQGVQGWEYRSSERRESTGSSISGGLLEHASRMMHVPAVVSSVFPSPDLASLHTPSFGGPTSPLAPADMPASPNDGSLSARSALAGGLRRGSSKNKRVHFASGHEAVPPE